MALIVQKFGGTSVANVDRIRNVAHRVAEEVNAGNQVVVVVSAMAGVTNQLVDWVKNSVTSVPNESEYDVVISTGEQVTCGLLALALNDMHIPSRSWLAWQLPLQTDSTHKKAQILGIDVTEIKKQLQCGNVAVIAGFQGLSPDSRITTLGRGGSDLTAVALADALGAERCDIYTDVDGVFTADPHVVASARKLDSISYLEMLGLAWQGAKVLQTRSVEYAMQKQVPTRVLSSFSRNPGTLVVNDSENENLVVGISSSSNASLFTLVGVNESEKLFAAFREAHIDFNIVGQGDNLMFTVPQDDLQLAEYILEEMQESESIKEVIVKSKVARVALVGSKIAKYRAQVTQKLLAVFASHKIEIEAIGGGKDEIASHIVIDVVISKDKVEEAVQSLHAAFGLDGNGIKELVA